MPGNNYNDIAAILYGSYIQYDRLYEMTKYAFYGKTDSTSVDIYIDVYSILRSLYSRGSKLRINYSYAIASCIINLAIHLRAYFETRHQTSSRVFIIYGGARPREAFVNYYRYNEKNILMEDSDSYMKNLIIDNLEAVRILCPYLYDIFAVIDMENEFSVIASSLIDNRPANSPSIIYSKELLAYQLVAYKPYTFLYRPKKSIYQDISWVVTKTTLYNAYRYGELKIQKQVESEIDIKMFSIYQAICGVRSRGMNALKNANSTLKFLKNEVDKGTFINGYKASTILDDTNSPLLELFIDRPNDIAEVANRFAAIDLNFQTMLYESLPYKPGLEGVINLYNPQEVRNINDKYFQLYPLDLNRV